MKNYTLKCFKNFKCKAGMCEDSCCVGWGIDIDKKTLDFYKKLEGQFADYVKQNIDFKSSSIKMCENGRCPFLNGDNLCDIILNLGEEHISYICTNHPRFFNRYDTHTEEGIGLCCEEGTRLLFYENEEMEKGFGGQSPLFLLRDTLFKIILRDDMEFLEKVYYFLDLICEADDLIFNMEDDKIIELINTYEFKKIRADSPEISGFLEVAKATEPIDNTWSKKLGEVALKTGEIRREFEKIIAENKEKYRKLFYYYTFRYLLKDIEEREIISKGKFIIYLLYMNVIFDGYSHICGDKNSVKNTILISKQMEYSEVNTEFIKKEAMENSVFDFENIIPIR